MTGGEKEPESVCVREWSACAICVKESILLGLLKAPVRAVPAAVTAAVTVTAAARAAEKTQLRGQHKEPKVFKSFSPYFPPDPSPLENGQLNASQAPTKFILWGWVLSFRLFGPGGGFAAA